MRNASGQNYIIYYSERGLVVFFVRQIEKVMKGFDRKSGIDGAKKILRILANSVKPKNLKDQLEKQIEHVKWFTVILEPSFGEYGDPDLILVWNVKNELHCAFIEAKKNSLHEVLKVPRLKSNNSTNASHLAEQLANKIRFASSSLEIKNNKPHVSSQGLKNKKLKKLQAIQIIYKLISPTVAKKGGKIDYNTSFYFLSLTDERSLGKNEFIDQIEMLKKEISSRLKGEDFPSDLIDNIGGISYESLAKEFRKINTFDKKEYGILLKQLKKYR